MTPWLSALEGRNLERGNMQRIHLECAFRQICICNRATINGSGGSSRSISSPSATAGARVRRCEGATVRCAKVRCGGGATGVPQCGRPSSVRQVREVRQVRWARGARFPGLAPWALCPGPCALRPGPRDVRQVRASTRRPPRATRPRRALPPRAATHATSPAALPREWR